MADSLKAVQDFIKSRNTLKVEEKKQFDDKVLHDYTRIFCLSDSVPVAESIYLSPSHLTMQEETGKVYYIYKSCKLSAIILSALSSNSNNEKTASTFAKSSLMLTR